MSRSVHNNLELQRFEMREDGELLAFLQYRLRGSVIDLLHAETMPDKRGRGFASDLVRQTLEEARQRAWQVRPYCPFVRDYMAEHAEFDDLMPADQRTAFGR
jgi:predicted GNAT family acetyltransferase